MEQVIIEQVIILGAAAITAAATTIGVILFLQCKKNKHSAAMTFKDLYTDNAEALKELMM